ncbi:hypothetical protein MNBD_GAMMA12-631 [hydrothermal vent metagenome]|uniref:Uncharacterized protein n=1 Tax=hydrothermal vent metagenome TaxID=652676 RepID=A0A3B0YGL4_9ZZZZ
MPVTLEIRSSSERLPCLLGGVSPFLFLVQSRITDSLFTWRDNPYYRYCGMTSEKSMSVNRGIPRRSERSSPEVSTKEAILLFFYMAMTLLLLRFNLLFLTISVTSLNVNKPLCADARHLS